MNSNDLIRRQVLDELYRQKALLTFLGDTLNAKRIDEVCYDLTMTIYAEIPSTNCGIPGWERVCDGHGGDMLTEVV